MTLDQPRYRGLDGRTLVLRSAGTNRKKVTLSCARCGSRSEHVLVDVGRYRWWGACLECARRLESI